MNRSPERRFRPSSRRAWRSAFLVVGTVVFLLPPVGAAKATVTLTPLEATVETDQTQDFVAVIKNTTRRKVSWKVCDGNGQNCVAGGNSTVGFIVQIGRDAQKNPIGRYTAPASVPSPPACTAVTDGCLVVIKVKIRRERAQPATAAVTVAAVSLPPGRNDSIATATPLTNGTYTASISPFADPVDTNPGNPDNDFYELVANAGATVTVEILAARLQPASVLDSVIEILDSNGDRFTSCRNEGTDDGILGNSDPTPDAFDDICANDDIELGVITDSKLRFRVPGAAGTVTFYVRVLDWRGDARPDLNYQIKISGVN